MARTPRQNQQMRDDRRERILSAAVRSFATAGLGATRVADIAAAVGMSQGLLYHYFPSKEDMFVEIVRRAFERMNAAVHQLERQPMTPRAKLELAAAHILHSLEHSDDFAWYSTLVSLASVSETAPEAAKAIILRERRVPYDVVARIVRAGQKDGTIRKHRPDELALTFWAAVKGLALHKTALGDAYRSPAPAVLTAIFFHGAQT